MKVNVPLLLATIGVIVGVPLFLKQGERIWDFVRRKKYRIKGEPVVTKSFVVKKGATDKRVTIKVSHSNMNSFNIEFANELDQDLFIDWNKVLYFKDGFTEGSVILARDVRRGNNASDKYITKSLLFKKQTLQERVHPLAVVKDIVIPMRTNVATYEHRTFRISSFKEGKHELYVPIFLNTDTEVVTKVGDCLIGFDVEEVHANDAA